MTRDHPRRRALYALAVGLSAGLAGCAGLDAALSNTELNGFDPVTGDRVASAPLPSDLDLGFDLVPVSDRLYGVGADAVYALR